MTLLVLDLRRLRKTAPGFHLTLHSLGRQAVDSLWKAPLWNDCRCLAKTSLSRVPLETVVVCKRPPCDVTR
ncbi:hypothetical protein H257_18081 [Aphanomyces astaci]|uniref:Uncharacterized protein n=1 Tax=Aphanomyces astaci TaxID=112090 RepID=W4FE28_APHAT|nr:hypothetical protein H257_18081 [Aphanomyces astaci]ETV65124.1 hypothetical protein H257_18081 [Aphanomyces astaci]|eukprot:XP_009845393.1 hypothetical protein H257_18081 [Aphanomyces astaci]